MGKFKKWNVLNRLRNLESRMYAIEAKEAKPESCASGCSPAGCGGDLSEAGRSPDREALAEVMTLIGNTVGRAQEVGHNFPYQRGWDGCCRYLLQCLEELDKGEAPSERQDAVEKC